MKQTFSVLIASAALLSFSNINGYCSPQSDKDTYTSKISLQTNKKGAQINPNMYGVFFEEINHAGEGGLYAELLKNRDFRDVNNNKPVSWELVSTDPNSKLSVVDDTPFHAPNLHSLLLDNSLSSGNEVSLTNDGFWGINSVKGASYRFNVYAKADQSQSLTVALISRDGKICASAKTDILTTNWKRYTLTLNSNSSDPKAVFKITATHGGKIWLNTPSLFPSQTYKNRRNGLRVDLANMVAALQPKFIRFPGGCYIEAGSLSNRFRWKDTVTDIAQRPGHFNDVWWYHSTDGLGYHEYLQMCEDMHAIPLFVASCGVSHSDSVPLNKMQETINEALDAIEYANGPVTSKWGALRSKNGHPKPFNLKYVEIGNENMWGPKYKERFRLIYKAIKAKYPKIVTIANGWVDAPVELVDDHFYNSPDWFWGNTGIYDNTSRKGAKVYVGEYAVTSDCGLGNLKAAIAEAAWMNGLERNADIVRMATYAPLFTNTNNRAWNPDAIVFDTNWSYGTPSYWVQKLYSENLGDIVIPTQFESNAIKTPEIISGSIGIGTWQTSAEFKDIEVITDGKPVYRSDFSKNVDGWKPKEGVWENVDNAYRISDLKDDQHTFLELPELTKLQDYAVRLKARKLAGKEGFLIYFRVKDDRTYYRWNIGGWGNTKDAISSPLNGSHEMCDRFPGSIETDRWYDIAVDVKGPKIDCYIDGKLVKEVIEPDLNQFSVITERKGNLVIIKAANASNKPVISNLTLDKTKTYVKTAKVLTLSSNDLNNENTAAAPNKIVPIQSVYKGVKSSFKYTFPAYSVTVLTIKENTSR